MSFANDEQSACGNWPARFKQLHGQSRDPRLRAYYARARWMLPPR